MAFKSRYGSYWYVAKGEHRQLNLDNKLTLCGDTEEEVGNDIHTFTGRDRLYQWLNLVKLQVALVIFVFVDVLIVSALLLIELKIIQVPPSGASQDVNGGGSGRVQRTSGSRNDSGESLAGGAEEGQQQQTLDLVQSTLHIVQLAVLSVFMLETILRVVAKGLDLIYDKWQIFDSLVVLVTFALYVSLTAAVSVKVVTYGVGYLIILRLWRIGRIYRDMRESERRSACGVILSHRKALKQAEEEVKQAKVKIERQQREIDSLKSHLRRLQKCAKSSPATYSCRSHMSEDTVTSDDELDRPGSHTLEADAFVEHVIGHIPSTPSSSLHAAASPQSSVDVSAGSSPTVAEPRACDRTVKTDSVFSDVSQSSGKIPDIVEHTQGADLCRDPSFLGGAPPVVVPLPEASGSGSGTTSPKDNPTMTTVVLVPPDVDLDGQEGPSHDSSQPHRHHSVAMDNEETRVTLNNGAMDETQQQANGASDSAKTETHKTVIQPHERVDKSSGSSDVVVNVTSMKQPEDTNHLDEASTGGILRQKKATVSKSLPKSALSKDPHDGASSNLDPEGATGGKAPLMPAGDEGEDHSYTNPSFKGDAVAADEINEIKRVSQVPFGSFTHLIKEGIPMTDL